MVLDRMRHQSGKALIQEIRLEIAKGDSVGEVNVIPGCR